MQLEKSNQQRRSLQEDNQQLTRQLAELQQRWSGRVKSLEEQLETLKYACMPPLVQDARGLGI